MEVAMKSNLNVVMELYHVRKYKHNRTFILFLFHVESREMAKLIFINMLLPPETDKVWLHTGVIVCGCDIQSNPRESELKYI